MSDSPILRAVERVMQAVNSRLARQDDTIKALEARAALLETRNAELDEQLQEQRSAPVLATQSIDIDAIATRAAALVPAPKDGVDGKDGIDGKDGVDGKDANTEEIAARVAELVMPRLAALIPPPIKGEKGDPGKDGERGDDGFPSEDEIRSFVREEVNVLQRSFYQGVFRDGTNYTCAQAVTWDGSMWVATRDTTSKPGTDDSWQLAVKRGRDAKR